MMKTTSNSWKSLTFQVAATHWCIHNSSSSLVHPHSCRSQSSVSFMKFDHLSHISCHRRCVLQNWLFQCKCHSPTLSHLSSIELTCFHNCHGLAFVGYLCISHLLGRQSYHDSRRIYATSAEFTLFACGLRLFGGGQTCLDQGLCWCQKRQPDHRRLQDSSSASLVGHFLGQHCFLIQSFLEQSQRWEPPCRVGQVT